jgi:hypothetical protein
MTISVTDNYESGETHVTAALNYLGDTLDGNDSVFKAALIFV